MLLLDSLFMPRQRTADITHTNGIILFGGSTFTMSFSETNGSLLAVRPADHTGTIFTGGDLGLWNALFKEGAALAPSSRATGKWATQSVAGTRVTCSPSAFARTA
jgi:hypothetical protein